MPQEQEYNYDEVSVTKHKIIVYIAGRNPAGGGDKSIIDELELSVMSSCRAHAIRDIGSSSLNFVIFTSEPDYHDCFGSSPGQCAYSRIGESCLSQLPTPTFRYAPLDDETLRLWKENTGIVSFSHHSTWFGYAKIWLPILLRSMGYGSSGALFVDTDTVWNDSPSVIFDELNNFNPTQVFGAMNIVKRHKGDNSMSFRNRITSGILLMDLEGIRKLDWAGIVRDSVTSNRGGIGANVSIPIDYNRSEHCEGFHWGSYWPLPFCLTEPYLHAGDENCRISRTCWSTVKENGGDQEFFSNIFSNFHPELLYDLPPKHQHIRMGAMGPAEHNSRNESFTLLHMPQISELWGKEAKVKDDELANMLPPVALESTRWFRKNLKNITY